MALDAYERGLELWPNSPDTLIGMGLVYIALTDHEKAGNCFNLVVLQDPENRDAWLGKAAAYTDDGEGGKAGVCREIAEMIDEW